MLIQKKPFWLVFLIVVIVSGFGLWWLLSQNPLSQPEIHFYNDSTEDLTNISLKVFYFVPANRKDKIFEDWLSVTKGVLEEMVSFHGSQFLGISTLNFKIYPRIVIGLEDNFFYDTADTSGGNPNALKKVGEEIKRRILDEKGDIYDKNFARKKVGEYSVLAILYEGVGAIGSSEGSLLLARGYLTVDKVKDYGASIFYHELMHTFGVPDFYESEDVNAIMGQGRFKPLKDVHILDEVKKRMGLD